jgi:DNA-binding response OmpR family regulator
VEGLEKLQDVACILVAEDDPALGKGIAMALQAGDREVRVCSSVKGVWEAVSGGDREGISLLILDIGLPDGSGLELCRELREKGYLFPVLMLTANDTEMDMVLGLESGADDYVTKPFSLAVLRARVDALLRRQAYREEEKDRGQKGKRQSFEIVGKGVKEREEEKKRSEVMEGMDQYGQREAARIVSDYVSEGDTVFRFDFDSLQFWKGNESVDLSKTEIKLLQLLWANKGHVLSRERLLSGIWPDGTQYVDENALSVAVRRLRSKLEADPSLPRYIKTAHGLGYLWEI